MIEELDYDVGVFNESAKKADANLAVRFYTQAIQNDARSAEEGRPIFDDVEMIEIRVRGDRNNVVQRPARDDDRRRFRDAYAAFKDAKKEVGSGTPLAEWPIMSSSMVEELKYLGFHTVEHVSEADDSACAKVAGLRTLKQKAQIFLDHAKGGAPLEAMSKANQELQDRLAASERLNSDLSKQLEELTNKFQKLADRLSDSPAPAETRAAPRR